MRFKKINILVMVMLFLISPTITFFANETASEVMAASTLEESIDNAIQGTNFNGSVMISENDGDSYNIIYEDSVGVDGGYDTTTLYDLGSVSKLYTTVAIMQLEENGDLSYDDSISSYLENVPSDKEDVTIEMLVKHTSGIYVNENSNHDVTKSEELERILNSSLSFESGTNYKYSNAGYTLLAAIIEDASGLTYEEYLYQNLFEPFGLLSTGFPDSEYLQDLDAVSGTLNGTNYGPVNQFDYGWFSKGYTDVVSTPREVTYFFQALISGEIVGSENLKLLSTEFTSIQNGVYRGFGSHIQYPETENKVIGHTGVWYGGNSAIFYRPEDQLLFVVVCDELVVNYDLPAIALFNKIIQMYPANSIDSSESLETVTINKLDSSFLPNFSPIVNAENVNYIDPLYKGDVYKVALEMFEKFVAISLMNKYLLQISICVALIIIILIILRNRIYKTSS